MPNSYHSGPFVFIKVSESNGISVHEMDDYANFFK